MAYIGLALPVIKPASGTGFLFGKAVSVDIDPQTSEASLYADNQESETDYALKSAKITLGTSTIPSAAYTAMYGHAVSGTNNDEVSFKTSDAIPYVGFGIYTEEVIDGVKKYVAMTCNKVKFSEPKCTYETKGETVSFKTPSIEGKALADDDKEWKHYKFFDTVTEVEAYLKEWAGITTDSQS